MAAIETKTKPNLESVSLDTEIYPSVAALTGLSESIYVQAQREAEGPIRNYSWGFSYNTAQGTELADNRDHSEKPLTWTITAGMTVARTEPSTELVSVIDANQDAKSYVTCITVGAKGMSVTRFGSEADFERRIGDGPDKVAGEAAEYTVKTPQKLQAAAAKGSSQTLAA